MCLCLRVLFFSFVGIILLGMAGRKIGGGFTTEVALIWGGGFCRVVNLRILECLSIVLVHCLIRHGFDDGMWDRPVWTNRQEVVNFVSQTQSKDGK
ncbi:hypothetical protein BD289DRAFT_124881 [Coniella lustricola]|uniref:Uncharacterized protein n=1 Tax=Coniella lustricola TaxID=2025994 RepID=A0A2T3AFV3_9PEZI|nr:hypothetical protein BD289DRAFT_124881 [Coniella lustricola]